MLDLDRARAALSEALVAASAPAHGGGRLRGARRTSPSSLAHWTVTMSVTPTVTSSSTKPLGKSVEAVIVDDAGTIVAQRTLTDRSARTCVPLARAVGAWASLVLDAEMVRTKDDDGSEPTPPPAGASSVPSSATSAALQISSAHPMRDLASSPDGEPTTRSQRALEIGAMVYLRNGIMASGAVSGLSPFVSVEFANAWILRPSLAVGRSTQGTPTIINHVGGRADVCRRIPATTSSVAGLRPTSVRASRAASSRPRPGRLREVRTRAASVWGLRRPSAVSSDGASRWKCAGYSERICSSLLSSRTTASRRSSLPPPSWVSP